MGIDEVHKAKAVDRETIVNKCGDMFGSLVLKIQDQRQNCNHVWIIEAATVSVVDLLDLVDIWIFYSFLWSSSPSSVEALRFRGQLAFPDRWLLRAIQRHALLQVRSALNSLNLDVHSFDCLQFFLRFACWTFRCEVGSKDESFKFQRNKSERGVWICLGHVSCCLKTAHKSEHLTCRHQSGSGATCHVRGANAMSLMASATSGALVPLVPFLEILQDQLLPFLLPSDMLRFTRASQQVVRHLRQDAALCTSIFWTFWQTERSRVANAA